MKLAILFLIIWLSSGNSLYIIGAGICGFVSIIEYGAYSQTILEITDDLLKVRRKTLLNAVNEEYEIEVATDMAFANIVASVTTTNTLYEDCMGEN